MKYRFNPDSASRKSKRESLAFAGHRSKLSINVMALFAAATIGASVDTYAADDKAFADLQSENLRLRQALDKIQQELALQKGGRAPSDSFASPSATTSGGSAITQNSDNPSPQQASQSLEKVVIQAPNQLVLLQDIPQSVSVVTGDELDRTGALNVTDVLKRIGNVQWNYGNPKTGSLSIRGISAGSTESIDPSLGVNVDGVAYAYVALASGSDYVDIDTVDVTRGPQGSTGGKNTSIGTINIRTKRPSFTPEANASITFGKQNALLTQATFGGPVIDDLLAWRATFYRNQQEGFYMNQFAPIQDRTSYVNTDRTYGRIQFLLTPGKDFSARFSADFKPKGIEFVNGLNFRNPTPATYIDGTPTNLNTDASTRLNRRYFTVAGYTYPDYLNQPINEDDNRGILNGSKGASAELNWNVANHLLTSITAFKNNFFQASNDEGTPFNITKNSGLFVNYKQQSQEFRIASTPGGFVDYTGGLFYIQTRSDANSRTYYGSDAGAWFATPAQYSALDALTNVNYGSGRALLKDSLDRTYRTQTTYTDNKSTAVFGQADWHLSEPLTLTTGIRFSREDRKTSATQRVEDTGFGAALNPVSAGGFASAANLAALQAANNAAQLNLADQVASQYFGAAITATPGAAYAGLTAAQKAQVTNAQAIRAAQAYNALYGLTEAEPYTGTLTTGNISLSYKLNDSLTTYASWQRGAKAGISQISGTISPGVGRSLLTLPESSNVFELGVKTSLLDNTLTVNADVFLDRLKNYQQTVNLLDPIATANTGIPTYISGTGNAPLVEIKGVEIDATYSGIRHTTLRFAGSYNDARYKDSVLLSNPLERGNLSPAFFDAKGQTLANAPKFTANLSADYRLPVFNNKEFHTNINYNYKSRFNSDASQSEYAWVDSYGLVDFSIGIGRRDRSFDFNFLVKNLLDTDYKFSQTWNSYVPGTPRWYGFVFSGKL